MPDQRRLVRPTRERLTAYADLIEDAQNAGEDGDGYNLLRVEPMRRNPAAYMRAMADFEAGRNLPESYVPQSTRWLLDADGVLVGEARIRHGLNDDLEVEGGHVGYFVGRHHRGLGHGRAILHLALIELRALGVSRVLVTCNADNHRSRRVIEANGGVFRRTTVSPRSGKDVATFWIENGA